MSSSFKNIYEFGEFRLDTREKILMQGDRPVEIAPKGFELLSVFVENQGRLLEKDELMDKIWADSFVEESNLTFNIRQLRKILGDDAHSPRYIKTVRRHGYRFIADVRQITESDKPAEENDPRGEPFVPAAAAPPVKLVIAEPRAAAPRAAQFSAPVFLAAFFSLVGALALGLWYAQNTGFETTAPVLAAPLSSEKLSTNGKVVHAVLTPDGKNVIYTSGLVNDRQSLWLRHLENGSSVEIIPASDDLYYGLAISPDGATLYFARRPRPTGEPIGVYRVSVFGGVPQKILDRTEGWMSLSPDGRRISYVRCPYRDDEFCSLMIADAEDGRNERTVVTRPRPFRIGDNRISPDGKRIVFAVGQSATSSNEFGLAEVDLETGQEREISRERFFNIKYLAWLPDQSGWLITAARVPTKNYRIWQVSAATGDAAALTKDSESYSLLNMNRDASRLISSQVKQDFKVRLINLENPATSRHLADGSSVAFAPDGKVYFTSIMSGNDEIWSMNADGSGQRQLTNHPADETVPVIANDNKTVYFLSNKTGAAQVWRMNTDGSNQMQLTEKEGGAPYFVSPDNAWVYFRHSATGKLWRVSTAGGGGEHLALDRGRTRFSAAPDGARVAITEKQGADRVVAVLSLADGQPVKSFSLADPQAFVHGIAWMPDGKNLAYITSDRYSANNVLWLQPLDGGAPRQIASLGDEEMSDFSLAVSPDGKTIAVAQGRWLHDAVLFNGLR